MIRSIALKRFKKFKELHLDLRPFTVLMGENSSGKTTILQAANLALLTLATQNLVYEDHSGAIKVRKTGVGATALTGINISEIRELFYGKVFSGGRRGGSVPAVIELQDDSGNSYKLVIRLLFGAYNIKCTSTLDDLAMNPSLHAKLPLYISGFIGLRIEEERAFPRVIQDRLERGRASEIIRNLVFDTKEHYPDAFARLNRRLEKDFDFHLGDVLFNPKEDLYVTAQYTDIVEDTRTAFSFNVSGSGHMQILQILAPIYRYCPDRSNVVLIDEPDAHLHPNLQTALATALQEIQAELNIQIVMSTHSTSIIRATDPANVVPISSNLQVCKPLASPDEVEQQIQAMIDTYTVAKSLISGKIIFLEDTDIRVLEAFDKLLGTKCFSGANTVPVLCGRGKDDKVPFQIGEVLQKLLGTPIEVHFIRDRDGLPEGIVKNITAHADARGLKLHFLSLYEIENYLLLPHLIRRALEQKFTGGALPSLEEIESKVKDALRDTIRLTRYDYIGKLEDAISKSGFVPGNEQYRNFPEARSEAKRVTHAYEGESDLAGLRIVGIGRDALASISSWLNDERKVSLSRKDILSALELADIPQDVANILEQLRSKEAKPRELPPRLEPPDLGNDGDGGSRAPRAPQEDLFRSL